MDKIRLAIVCVHRTSVFFSVGFLSILTSMTRLFIFMSFVYFLRVQLLTERNDVCGRESFDVCEAPNLHQLLFCCVRFLPGFIYPIV